MTISGRNVGVGITGSFCTFSKVTQAIRDLTAQGATVLPIFSYNAQSIDSRFGTANYWLDTITQITGKDPILTIPQAEPLGPKNMLDLLLIAPCTGNTLAKLANGITDTPVLMAAKGHLRFRHCGASGRNVPSRMDGFPGKTGTGGLLSDQKRRRTGTGGGICSGSVLLPVGY